MAHAFGDERHLFIRRSLHIPSASLREAPPDLRARAAALERALPHVNYSVTRTNWFVDYCGFVTPSVLSILQAQPLAYNDGEVRVLLRNFAGPVKKPLRLIIAAFAVELFRRHRHAIDLVMPRESVRQYDNLCSFTFALVVDSAQRQQTPFRGLNDLHNTWDPTPS